MNEIELKDYYEGFKLVKAYLGTNERPLDWDVVKPLLEDGLIYTADGDQSSRALYGMRGQSFKIRGIRQFQNAIFQPRVKRAMARRKAAQEMKTIRNEYNAEWLAYS